MSNHHAASILEVMSVSSEEKTGKTGKKFTIAKLACTIFQDDTEISVGNHDMFLDAAKSGADLPRAGFFYPRYEPRARWDSPSFSGVIVEMVPVPAEIIKGMLQKRYGAVPSVSASPSQNPQPKA